MGSHSWWGVPMVPVFFPPTLYWLGLVLVFSSGKVIQLTCPLLLQGSPSRPKGLKFGVQLWLSLILFKFGWDMKADFVTHLWLSWYSSSLAVKFEIWFRQESWKLEHCWAKAKTELKPKLRQSQSWVKAKVEQKPNYFSGSWHWCRLNWLIASNCLGGGTLLLNIFSTWTVWMTIKSSPSL